MSADTVIALLGLVVVILSAAAAALIWFVRLEGKVETLRALYDQHREHVDRRHEDLGERIQASLTDIRESIGKIFDRLESKADKTK